MGTNYYLKRIPTKEEIVQCHRLLDEGKIEYEDINKAPYGSPYLDQVLSTMTERVHIGKYAGGWRFIFRIQSDLYGKSIRSCLDYLARSIDSGLWRICDEYGETIPIDDFEKLVRDSLGGITIDGFYQKHPEERRSAYYAPQQEVVEDGSRWWDVDFC